MNRKTQISPNLCCKFPPPLEQHASMLHTCHFLIKFPKPHPFYRHLIRNITSRDTIILLSIIHDMTVKTIIY